MYRRAVRFAVVICAAAMLAVCGGSGTKSAGTVATSNRIGGAQDSAIAFLRSIDRPARTIYDQPVDLTLRTPTATPGTAVAQAAGVAQAAKAAAKTPSESDTTRAKH